MFCQELAADRVVGRRVEEEPFAELASKRIVNSPEEPQVELQLRSDVTEHDMGDLNKQALHR